MCVQMQEHQGCLFLPCRSSYFFFFLHQLNTGCFFPIPRVTQCLLCFPISADSGTLKLTAILFMFFYCKVCTKRRLCDWGNLRDVRWALTYRRGLSSCLRSVSDQQSSTNVTPPGHQPANVHLELHLNSKLTLTCTKSEYKQQLSSLALLGLMLILIGWRMLECDLSSLFLLYFQKKSRGEWLHMVLRYVQSLLGSRVYVRCVQVTFIRARWCCTYS